MMTKTPNGTAEGKERFVRRVRTRVLILAFFSVLGIPGGFFAARMIDRPLVNTLHTYRPDIITKLYDRNGKVFWEYSIQNRIVVPISEMSPHLFNAIVATEDARFLEHGGVDPKAILRAGVRNLVAGRKEEGGSTLTQQLAKLLFLTPEKTWRRKANEAFLAVEIEKNFTKDQIFEMYVNQVYLGHGAYGVESASRLYFGKHAKDLNVPEAALIAGLFQRPEGWSPINDMKASLTRRNHVLRRMLAENLLSQEQYDRALKTPIVLGSYDEETPDVGAYFAEEIRKYLEKNYGTEDLYRSGLEVYTTLDLGLQEATESAVRHGLGRFDKKRGFRKPARNVVDEGMGAKEYEDPAWSGDFVEGRLIPAVVVRTAPGSVLARIGNDELTLTPEDWQWAKSRDVPSLLTEGDIIHVLFESNPETGVRSWKLDQLPQIQAAAVVLDSDTGEILAMVGGYDFSRSKFNRAVQSLRQPGSAFKAMVVGAAYELGVTPADAFFDEPIAIPLYNDEVYSPRNFYTDKFEGILTVQRAIEMSINIPTVKMSEMIGRENVVNFARRCGIVSDLQPYPSVALGAFGVSPLELAGAYNTLANQGVHVKPRMIRRITNSSQKVIEENFAELSEATSAQVAYLVTHTLQGVVWRGTGFAAHELPGAYAGKTGTTNGFTDAWFVGYSPEFTVAVWVGNDDPAKSLGRGGTGAEAALPIWIETFEKLDQLGLRGEPRDSFDVPPGIIEVPFDLRTGRRGRGPCQKVVIGAFLAGTEPDRDCNGEPMEASRERYVDAAEPSTSEPRTAPNPPNTPSPEQPGLEPD